ncbi:MAG: hypothetical protein LBE13_16680, partial [Bacteroidales bacterium]|nr:hypothetical protein [Bacteroidales bacterium]
MKISEQKRLTKSGLRMHYALRKKKQSDIGNEIMCALVNAGFGRNNLRSPSSDSEIEAPHL